MRGSLSYRPCVPMFIVLGGCRPPLTAACCCHVCYVCQFLIFMVSWLWALRMPALVVTFCKNRRRGLVELKHVVLRVGIFSELHSSLAVLMILSVSKRKQIRTRNAMTMWQAYVFQEVFFPQTHSNMLSCIAEVVFPLWTKWLVTNPMPTQHLTQSCCSWHGPLPGLFPSSHFQAFPSFVDRWCEYQWSSDHPYRPEFFSETEWLDCETIRYWHEQYPKWPSIAAVGGQQLAEDSPATWPTLSHCTSRVEMLGKTTWGEVLRKWQVEGTQGTPVQKDKVTRDGCDSCISWGEISNRDVSYSEA